jgi:hypothetical protein
MGRSFDFFGGTMIVSPRRVSVLAAALLCSGLGLVAPAVAEPAPANPVCRTALEPPVVTGEPTVGQVLAASVATSAPETVTWTWRRDGSVVGSRSERTVQRTDPGSTLAVTATVESAGCEPVASSTDVVVAKLVPVLATPAIVVGRPSVGSRLQTTGDTYDPSPYTFSRVVRWFRGDTHVATAWSYVVTPDDAGHDLRAEVRTVSRYAEDVVSTTSPVTIATGPLTGSRPEIRQASVGATQAYATDPGFAPATDDLVKTYRWFRDGVEVPSGQFLDVRPEDHRAELVVEVTATTSGYGSLTVRSDPVRVVGPDATLGVSASPAAVQVGSSSTVTVRGLGPKEPFSVSLSGTRLAQGVASTAGVGTATIRVPSSWTTASRRTLRVVGDQPRRTGATTVATGRSTRLGIRLGTHEPSPRLRNVMWVSRLLPHEKVTVRIDGKVVLSIRASSTGSFRWTFDVGRREGRRTLTVTGAGPQRSGSTTYRVRR